MALQHQLSQGGRVESRGCFSSGPTIGGGQANWLPPQVWQPCRALCQGMLVATAALCERGSC
eukprot:1642048-Alexandrium_andersonii.AAC.1